MAFSFNLLVSLLVSTLLVCFTYGADSKYDILKEDWCGDSNCYDILGVTAIDDRRAIKQRYNNISLELHPDKNPNATDAQKELYVKVNKAYEILSNEALRSKYDEYLKLKSSLDSPKENVIMVLFCLYLIIAFLTFQYQKQRHKQLRNGILEHTPIQQWLIKNKNIDIDVSKSKKKPRRVRARKNKNKKGSQSDLNDAENNNDETENNDESGSWMDNVDDDTINEALNALNTVVPGWNGESPSYTKSLYDVPMFVLNKTTELIGLGIWHFQHTLLKKELTSYDREELCRKHFQKSHKEWDGMNDSERNKFLQRPGPWKADKNKRKKKKSN